MPAAPRSGTGPSSAGGPGGRPAERPGGRPEDVSTGLSGSRLALEPVHARHVGDLRRILAQPAVWQWWGDEAKSPDWPFNDPSSIRYAIVSPSPLGGRVMGMIQYSTEDEPMYRHASVDIFLDTELHGRGLGREAIQLLAEYLVGQMGHHRLVIDPAASNGAAIRCYSSVRFKPVGVMRKYEQAPDGSGWRDGLLMDLLAEEL